MEEQKDMVLEVENLNVKFVMEEETVEAVNNISLQYKKRGNPGTGGRDRCRKNHNSIVHYEIGGLAPRSSGM